MPRTPRATIGQPKSAKIAVNETNTVDGGRTWTKWGIDPDKASPFDVEVNRETVYGFRIVIVGKNGLATSTPQTGEAADIWVGVDSRFQFIQEFIGDNGRLGEVIAKQYLI